MALLDHKGESEFPFKKDTVFHAICKAISVLDGMTIDSADQLTGRIMVKAGVSLFSWGENIPIQLLAVSSATTKVQITSTPKTGIMFGGAFDMGKNRNNIEKILTGTSRILSTLQPEEQHSDPARSLSVADEIQKLRKLQEEGILTAEEFNQQKTKLLNTEINHG
ncbi:SHOCT domain-containing protein [Niabella sp. CJ426]|uniref:SHOCT domain-containing protein n=1 Tax=Niabella sp. CJ426 TaxID=3393740 RepID=UPI003D0006D9